VDHPVYQRGWDEAVCEEFAQTRMFPRRRCAKWRGGAIKNSSIVRRKVICESVSAICE
jgi:hypothetical protein